MTSCRWSGSATPLPRSGTAGTHGTGLERLPRGSPSSRARSKRRFPHCVDGVAPQERACWSPTPYPTARHVRGRGDPCPVTSQDDYQSADQKLHGPLPVPCSVIEGTDWTARRPERRSGCDRQCRTQLSPGKLRSSPIRRIRAKSRNTRTKTMPPAVSESAGVQEAGTKP